MDEFKPFDDKIVLFGQSCVGKTTFAKLLTGHNYLCFDELFNWHMIETLGLSIATNLSHIKNLCEDQEIPYVLDGWHSSDKDGKLLPKQAVAYVVWAPYNRIISQYRIPVNDPEEFRSMYKRWYYEINYMQFQSVRYFKNENSFTEISESDFYFLRT